MTTELRHAAPAELARGVARVRDAGRGSLTVTAEDGVQSNSVKATASYLICSAVDTELHSRHSDTAGVRVLWSPGLCVL